MSEMGTPFQKGGGGTNFEQHVQAAFIVGLAIRGNCPCIPTNEIIGVALQTTSHGWATDDMMVTALSSAGQHKLLFQIKHNISFSVASDIFKEVVKCFWTDFGNVNFDKSRDRLIIVKKRLTNNDSSNLKVVLNFAKSHANEVDFFNEVKRIGNKYQIVRLFESILTECNNGVDVTKKELWQFISCIDLLGYDFLDEGSIDQGYLLNLIKIAKSAYAFSTESEIWNEIIAFVTKLNPNGGSITRDSIGSTGLNKYFDNELLSPHRKAITLLRQYSESILKPLKNVISANGTSLHIDTTSIEEKIFSSVSSCKLTLVTGRPGAGKSASVKNALISQFPNATIFVFNADQFNQPSLNTAFSGIGINEPILDLLTSISLIPDKLIILESLEKLLEDANPNSAFAQLLSLLDNYPEIKVVGTVRRYAIDLVKLKFGIETESVQIIEIPPISNADFNKIADTFPQLATLRLNEPIVQLLKSPKYIELTLKAIVKDPSDFSHSNITEFKTKLWNSLIRDETANRGKGIPEKRERAFIEIATKRAREMKLFVKPSNIDDEAVALLEHDEIILQDNHNGKYCPAHDIFEDWALSKHISLRFDQSEEFQDFFDKIGSAPAIRRAFRLWIEDCLEDNSDQVMRLVEMCLSPKVGIDRYWIDEIIVSIFKSRDCRHFFTNFSELLLEGDAVLLHRCIHLLRTCCKEGEYHGNSQPLLIPMGSGWQEIIFFIANNLSNLNKSNRYIVSILLDWEIRLLFREDIITVEEMLAAKSIVLHLIQKIEHSNDRDTVHENVERQEELIALLFNLAQVAAEEIKDLFEKATTHHMKHDNWRLGGFYSTVLKKSMSGLGTDSLAKHLPELIVDTAWLQWKYEKPKPSSRSFHDLGDDLLARENTWGINNNHSFFEPSIYKTPFYRVLHYHPLTGLKFIADFLNHATLNYIKSYPENKLAFKKIEIELNNGMVISQYGSEQLWTAYRGQSVTHYCIQCLLISLEKYLLVTAEHKTEVSKKNIGFIYEYLLRNSNNVTTTSVLASVAMAYPQEVEEAMLPLFSTIEFFQWDLHRAVNERTRYDYIPDSDAAFIREERAAFHALPHRRKYYRGLSEFVIDHQFNVQRLNNKIHSIFDKLKSRVTSDDLAIKKMLTEIDIRNHRVGEYDEVRKAFYIAPVYDSDVEQFMNLDNSPFKGQQERLGYSSLLAQGLKESGHVTIQIWRECFQYYLNDNQHDSFEYRPVSLAVIGLRDYVSQLTYEEKDWCIESILNTLVHILRGLQDPLWEAGLHYNIMEKEVTLQSVHFCYSLTSTFQEKSALKRLVLQMLCGSFNDQEIGSITVYFGSIFFEKFETDATQIWNALIRLSRFRKLHPPVYFSYDEPKRREYALKEQAFLEDLFETAIGWTTLEKVSFQTHDASFLTRAFLTCPYTIRRAYFFEFAKQFIPLIIKDVKLPRSEHFIPTDSERHVDRSLQYLIRKRIGLMLFQFELNQAKELIDIIFANISINEEKPKYGRLEDVEFAAGVFDNVVYYFDKAAGNCNDAVEKSRLIARFWEVWEYFFDKISNDTAEYFSKVLFLDMYWQDNATTWFALDNKKDFYKKLVVRFGKYNVPAIVNFLSAVGMETFLPEGIHWLFEVIKKDERLAKSLATAAGEKLFRRIYNNHIMKIKDDKILVQELTWLLDRMIDLGSSEAYFILENVITFKKS